MEPILLLYATFIVERLMVPLPAVSLSLSLSLSLCTSDHDCTLFEAREERQLGLLTTRVAEEAKNHFETGSALTVTNSRLVTAPSFESRVWLLRAV